MLKTSLSYDLPITSCTGGIKPRFCICFKPEAGLLVFLGPRRGRRQPGKADRYPSPFWPCYERGWERQAKKVSPIVGQTAKSKHRRTSFRALDGAGEIRDAIDHRLGGASPGPFAMNDVFAGETKWVGLPFRWKNKDVNVWPYPSRPN